MKRKMNGTTETVEMKPEPKVKPENKKKEQKQGVAKHKKPYME